MTFETVLISALFLTHLTIPTQFLQTFRFHFVAQPFGGPDFGFFHLKKNNRNETYELGIMQNTKQSHRTPLVRVFPEHIPQIISSSCA